MIRLEAKGIDMHAGISRDHFAFTKAVQGDMHLLGSDSPALQRERVRGTNDIF
jgi:hypothetical protein